jgi:predicted ribosome quality control (RQC) complex YloA/Tae2 family protein
LGTGAGLNATTGVNNVYIGAGVEGVAGESDTCYIASIFGQTSAAGIPVLINSSQKLGTITSSKRFKEEIRPMDKASEALFSLKPVNFRYKKEIDPAGTPQFGLVAEDVEKVDPDLIVRDKDGKPYSVRYDQVNAMLLNEFLKEHCKVEKLEAALRAVNQRLAEQDEKIQKVSAELQLSRQAPQTVSTER